MARSGTKSVLIYKKLIIGCVMICIVYIKMNEGGRVMKRSKKIVAVFLSCAMLVTSFLPVNAQEATNVSEEQLTEKIIESGWQGSIQNGTLCYVSDEGEKLTGIQEIDGQLYYFDDEGNAQTGWIEINGNLYYFALESGQAYRNTVQMIDGVEYEFSPEGIATEKIQDAENGNDETELENPDKEDAQENDAPDDNYQSVDTPEPEDGQDSTDTDVAAGEQQGETAEDTTISGWQTSNGIMKYYSASGEYLTGKCKVSGNWYYFDASGYRVTGWIWYNDHWYYCCPGGYMVTGWNNVNNKWYYMDPSGIMQTGYITINGLTYYLDPSSGARFENGYTPDGHYFDKDGVMII